MHAYDMVKSFRNLASSESCSSTLFPWQIVSFWTAKEVYLPTTENVSPCRMSRHCGRRLTSRPELGMESLYEFEAGPPNGKREFTSTSRRCNPPVTFNAA